jgi:CO/xanthine dehydrogenase Mo-binding subunit
MATRYFGKRVQRNEDPRLLTGQALFVDDVNLPGMLHAAYYRSPYAHARILEIDVSRAQEKEGVVAVYTAEDLGDYWRKGVLNVSPPPIEGLIFNERLHYNLAKNKVRHVGEPIVCVVAESRYIAEDAVNEVVVNFDPLPVNIDPKKALEPDAALLHEDLENNIAAHVIQKKGDYEKAKAEADLVITRDMVYDRGAAAAMENRGIVADWDQKSGRLTMWDTTQAPVSIRNLLAGILGLSGHQIRLIAPFIGGGFGPKILMMYPEEMLIPSLWLMIYWEMDLTSRI